MLTAGEFERVRALRTRPRRRAAAVGAGLSLLGVLLGALELLAADPTRREGPLASLAGGWVCAGPLVVVLGWLLAGVLALFGWDRAARDARLRCPHCRRLLL